MQLKCKILIVKKSSKKKKPESSVKAFSSG